MFETNHLGKQLDTIVNPPNKHTIVDQGCSWTTPLKKKLDDVFFSPARWGLLDFNRALLLLRLLRLLTRRLLLAVQIPVGTAGRVTDRSGHCRTSTATSRSQWALPDLNREIQIPVGTAGPQPRAPDPSGHCRTSIATSRSQWALPDLNRDFQIAVGTAGPQREECQKRCQIECQKICQIECQKDVRRNVRRYARQNVRRYARKNVRRYVR